MTTLTVNITWADGHKTTLAANLGAATAVNAIAAVITANAAQPGPRPLSATITEIDTR